MVRGVVAEGVQLRPSSPMPVSPEGRGVEVVAEGGCARRAVEFMFPGRADVGADMFVDGIGQAAAEAQAVRVHGIEMQGLAGGKVGIRAVLPCPEILGVQIKGQGVREVPDVAEARMQAHIRGRGVEVGPATVAVAQVVIAVFVVQAARPEASA